MEPFNAGWLSIVPPIVAIALALITKEVLSSLVLGILTGTLIYTIGMDGNVLMGTLESAFTVMGNKVDFNILIFCSLLGALVYVVAMSGGTKAYGNWAVKRIKGRKSALAATTGLGALIFIDDYFNCLTVGTVMRPICDRYNIARAKLAYIISNEQEKITHELLARDMGVTRLTAEGAYTHNDKPVLLCAVRHREIVAVKRLVNEIDPTAFFIVCDAREVLGEGFGEYKPDGL